MVALLSQLFTTQQNQDCLFISNTLPFLGVLEFAGLHKIEVGSAAILVPDACFGCRLQFIH